MTRLFSTALVAVLLTACAAPRPRAEASAPPPAAAVPAGPPVSVELEAASRDEGRYPVRVRLEGNASPTLAEDECLRRVETALRADGFPSASASSVNPVEVRVRFSHEAPFFGASYFGGGSHKHGLELRAFRGEKLLWELSARASGPAEDIRPLLPSLLAGAAGHFGRSTGGKTTVAVSEPTPKAPPAPGQRSARRGLLQRLKD